MSAIPVPKRPVRPATVAPRSSGATPTRVHDWAQASGRMLVSTFFIASSVSNMGGSSFGFEQLIEVDSPLIFNAIIYSMAFAVLVGRYVHFAALALGLIMLWSATTQLTQGTTDLAGYWQDLAIIGALFFMAASRGSRVMPAISRAMHRNRGVTPRRIVPESRMFPENVVGTQATPARSHVARPVAGPVFASRRAG